MRWNRLMVVVGVMAGLLGVLLLASPASAQLVPEGADCEVFAAPDGGLPEPGFSITKDFDLVVMEYDDDSSEEFMNVKDGEKLFAPDGLLIVRIHKCQLPEVEPTPEPEPTATAVPEPTPTTAPEPTPTTAPEPTPTTEPTTAPQPTPVPVEPEATPDAEVLGKTETRELAVTGVESTWLAVVGVALLAGGALLAGSGLSRRSRV